MGGMGSGRRWHYGSANTVDQFRALDVRKLMREGWLKVGQSSDIVWSCNGIETGRIAIHSQADQLTLDYRTRIDSGDWQSMSYPVKLTSTPCHMGGTRQWFLCPVAGCGQRVAILYGGTVFACRHCHGLAYPSQRETSADRALRRAEHIRERLGWPSGVLNGSGWGKPKGMHQRTYDRLCGEHAELEHRVTLDVLKRFGDLG